MRGRYGEGVTETGTGTAALSQPPRPREITSCAGPLLSSREPTQHFPRPESTGTC